MLFDRTIDMERFIAVAEAGSILAGAHALGMTQPALSRVIQRLERCSKDPLFDRHSRGITLTEFGVKALECARRLMGEHEAAESELLAIADRPRAPTKDVDRSVRLTPEEHVRLSAWLVQEAGRRSGAQTLIERREVLSAMPRHELGRVAALCHGADDDRAALTRAADIVRCAGPDLRT